VRFYAERPARVVRQLVADLLGLGWLAGFIWVAWQARELLLRLRAPTSGLANAGTQISDAFAAAARTAARAPFVGANLAAALDSGRAAGQSLAALSGQQISTISSLANGAAVVMLLAGITPALVLWLPVRIHYARMAGAAMASREADPDLLALRALTATPVQRLHAAVQDPASGWRRADPDVIRTLAELELRRLGLRAPHDQPPISRPSRSAAGF
jgi:hypothetical protein